MKTNSELEDAAVQSLRLLNGNNGNKKTNESEKQCDGVSRRNDKRPGHPCDIDYGRMRGVRDEIKTEARDKDADDDDLMGEQVDLSN